MKDSATQTEPVGEILNVNETAASQDTEQNTHGKCSKWSAISGAVAGKSLADEVKKVAESAMQQTGFVYEETSGMYYDYNTGYYYNAVSTVFLLLKCLTELFCSNEFHPLLILIGDGSIL